MNVYDSILECAADGRALLENVLLGTITINGVTLQYFDAGGDGIPVVFQHGLAADHTQSREVCSGLSGLRQITLECRGHGASALGPEEEVSLVRFADDVLELLDHLGIERAFFGGISMGAAIAARIAGLQPQRVRGLMLARPAWFDAPVPPHLWCLTAVAALMRHYPRAEARALFLSSDSYDAIGHESPDNAALLLGLFDRPDLSALAVVLARLVCADPGVNVAALTGLSCPVSVVANENDPMHPVALARRWAAALPAARFTRIPSRSIDRPRHFAELGAALRALCNG